MPEMLTIKGMHSGEKVGSSAEDLTFCKQMGVEYVLVIPPYPLTVGITSGFDLKDTWNADALAKFREYVESFGLKLAALHLPLTAHDISGQRWSNIMLGTPERDRDIEEVCRCIEAAGKAGIPLLQYNLSILPVIRGPGRFTNRGRGGVSHTHWDYAKMKDEPMHPAGPVSAEQVWERIEYFIKRVIPVAEEYKVKMGCHPNDISITPGTTYRGIAPVLGSIDGLKRFVNLTPSPYHGLKFCQGCITEFSTSPEQVYEAIRWFGSRKRIFWVHFRNVCGGLLKFREALPDEGDIDMLKAMRTYKEVGYNGVFETDHVPKSTLDTAWGHRSRAFGIGYNRALIQAVESEN